jgi:DNA-binding transcriptional LysR family regulator
VELRQLKQFVVVAEELNFRRAADRLHMTQPPLTAAVQRLEEDLGVELFDRSRQGVRLTPAGSVFLGETRRVLAQADLATHAAREAAHGKTGVLRLATVPSAAFELLPAILPAFIANHPQVRLHLTSDTSGRELASLRDGMLDLAIVVPPMTEQKGLDITLLKIERLVLAVSATHRLAGERCVKLSSVAEDPLVSFSFSESPGYAASILNACKNSGFFPRVIHETWQMPISLTLVAANMGVALVPSPMRRVQIDNVNFIEVTDETGGPLPYTLSFATRSDCDNSAVFAFMEAARKIEVSQPAEGG